MDALPYKTKTGLILSVKKLRVDKYLDLEEYANIVVSEEINRVIGEITADHREYIVHKYPIIKTTANYYVHVKNYASILLANAADCLIGESVSVCAVDPVVYRTQEFNDMTFEHMLLEEEDGRVRLEMWRRTK